MTRRELAGIEAMPISDIGMLVDKGFFKVEGTPASVRLESRTVRTLFTYYEVMFFLASPSGRTECRMDASVKWHIYQLLFNDLQAAERAQQPVLVAGEYDAAKARLMAEYVRVENSVYHGGCLWREI